MIKEKRKRKNSRREVTPKNRKRKGKLENSIDNRNNHGQPGVIVVEEYHAGISGPERLTCVFL